MLLASSIFGGTGTLWISPGFEAHYRGSPLLLPPLPLASAHPCELTFQHPSPGLPTVDLSLGLTHGRRQSVSESAWLHFFSTWCLRQEKQGKGKGTCHEHG